MNTQSHILSGVSRRFGSTLAVDGITPFVPAGQFVSVIGSSAGLAAARKRTCVPSNRKDEGQLT
ncbi:hypothetical protein J6524_10070 [Bradyrhizobium sp. WSM 1738]|uniref:hypothetical protein n=1 Tax=Bradyrhizobium hereditatis TaxID=2821405 RepID=UPI001CE36E2D|nr:hypothetical protein [Bradyrhizobium hereditatis]MCA6115240.1 hypothetical protein [Bradyrhizobium hereditatis]